MNNAIELLKEALRILPLYRPTRVHDCLDQAIDLLEAEKGMADMGFVSEGAAREIESLRAIINRSGEEKGKKCYQLEIEKAELQSRLTAKDDEIEKLKELFVAYSERADKILSQDECKACEKGAVFPSPVCCECIFDSVYDYTKDMDEKAVEQALKGKE